MHLCAPRPHPVCATPGPRMRSAMAAPAPAPVTRQVSGSTGPAPVPSGSERGQPLAAAVAALPVLDASGRPVPFGELFRERRAVVVFVRVSAAGDLACATANAAGHMGPCEGAGPRAESIWLFPSSSTAGVLDAKRPSLPGTRVDK